MVRCALLLLLLGTSPVWARPANPHLVRAVRLLDRGEDERALKALNQALKWRGSTRVELAQVHFHLGVVQFNLNRPAVGAKHFELAFEIDPQLQVPNDLSPKILKVVERIRRKHVAPAEPQSRPPTSEVVTRPAPPVAVAPTPPPPPPRSRVNWPAWVTLGLAVTAGGVGLALGVVARNEANTANDPSLFNDEAQATRDRAERYSLSANILFGVAAASAVVSGVLFIVGRRDREAPRASIAPVRGGALVQLDGVRW